ncbi:MULTISPECIES: hypothetical protein [unclassified Chamaesiphon]|uniref:hypothetical protein n=1 Tax=unclassified Chamaesiphon TaxID=2620921 RepID=UPI00286A1A3B|nr:MULTISPECIES: hypothetical protein [unclassified Chamaesiphon]
MNQESEFPFERARRVKPVENQEFGAVLVKQFRIDLKKRNRPVKEENKISPLDRHKYYGLQ